MNNAETKDKKTVSIRTLYQILIIPCYILGIDSIFTIFFYMAFTGSDKKEDMLALMSYGSGVSFNWILFHFAFMMVLFIIWFNPIRKYSQNPCAELRKVARRKFTFIYRDIFTIFIAAFAAKVVSHIVVYRNFIIWKYFLIYNLPSMLISIIIQFCFTIVFLDNLIFKGSDEFMRSIYENDELYGIKEGHHISLSAKIIMLFVSTAVIPMGLMYVFVVNSFKISNDQISALYNLLLVGSLTPMILGVAFFAKNIQGPVNELIAKMKKLSEGDFDVKTRIYFTDEIASLKANFNIMTDQLRERELLRETFGKYVSIEVVKELLKSGKMNLGGEEIEATVLFCDIRNFTTLSEKMSAGEVVDMLNSYFSFITAPISENHGVVNKFIGDAVMAIYMPAFGSADHAMDAVKSALKMRESL
ncbi:MAG TPA: adenylate/guanylate cyclase domain-containing protein, partial [Candidatus Wallbacteria bacterium]|nr:adenylate/guanylate cyclase domain-containing protein [Candidatus Wallbacteria bacterium]